MGSLKFLHTSDWHAGAGRLIDKVNRNGNLDYLHRMEWHWRQTIEVAKREKVAFALIAGDMFENSGTTIEELLTLYRVLVDFGKVCPVIASAGNHDELEVGDFQTKYLALMNIPNVRITQGTPESFGLYGGAAPAGGFHPDPKAECEMRVLVMPWTGIKDQKEFEAKIREHHMGEPVVMLHECFKDIRTDTGYRAKIGVQVPDIQGVLYYALGDIHLHQNVSLPHAWYSGAPGQYNFGDKPGKGCIVVDVDHPIGQAAPSFIPRFVKIPSHIELHQISALTDIPADSPHWYQLIVPANKVPGAVPPSVKEIRPIAAKIEMPIEFSKEDASQMARMKINYTDGVEELLVSAGYLSPEIVDTKSEMEKVAQGA